MNRKVLVFGYFGYATNQLDGQTIKTRNTFELIKNRYDGEVVYSDTQAFRKSLKSILSFLYNLISCKTLVILPCLNNLKYIFPTTYYLSKIFKYEIVHIGIGGWHDKYLSKWKLVSKLLRKININLLETQITVDTLIQQFNYKNVALFPNFRDEEEINNSITKKDDILRIVFMARVNIKKGLDTLAVVCKMILYKGLDNKMSLTLYGPIESEEDGNFLKNNILNKYHFVEYKGSLSPEAINSTLKLYDVMLFPTHYFTEGFPGSVLDAFNAGIPIIATEWQHSHQFIKNGRNGFIVDFENPAEGIFNHLKKLSENSDLLAKMKEESFQEHSKYTADAAWKILSKYIN